MVRKPDSAKPNLAEQNSKQTRDQLAELAGVGHSTIDKVAYIQEHGSDNTDVIQNGYNMDTQVSLGKVRLELGKESRECCRALVCAGSDGQRQRSVHCFQGCRDQII